MSKELSFVIQDANTLVQIMNTVWQNVQKGLNGGPVKITLGRVKRTPAQNRRMWAVLDDVSEQVEWHGQHLDRESWKHVFSAGIEQQQIVPGINGGLVVLGVSTRNKDKEWFSELFELINSFGAERGIKWSDPALEAFDYYREAS